MLDSKRTKPVSESTIPSDWVWSQLAKVIINSYSGGTPARDREEFYEGGTIPWIKSGEINQIYIKETEECITEKGLKKSSAKIVPKGTLLFAMYGATAGVTGFTHIDAALNQAILAIFPNETKLTKEFLFFYLVFQKDRILTKFTQGGQPNLSSGLIKALNIPVPPVAEQRAIARVLGTMDELISKTNRLIAQKELRKKWLMQNLLTGKKRLKGFTKKWKTVKLSDVAYETVDRNNGSLSSEALMAVTKAFGIIPMRERVQGEDVSRCKLIERDSFAYNPMRLNIGSIARWKESRLAMVSGDYVVFQCIEDQLDPNYLDFFRQTNFWSNFVERAGDGSVRVRIYFSHLKYMKLTLPQIDEQIAIAQILLAADKEITLLKAKTEKLREQKKGLMQQLLTGKRRLVLTD